MMNSRNSTAAPVLAVLAIALLLIGGYVGGYFWLGRASPVVVSSSYFPEDREGIDREYEHRWLRTLFAPLGWVEAKLGRYPVTVGYAEDHADTFWFHP